MPEYKISELTNLPVADVALDDMIPIVDKSANGGLGLTKRTNLRELISQASSDVTSVIAGKNLTSNGSTGDVTIDSAIIGGFGSNWTLQSTNGADPAGYALTTDNSTVSSITNVKIHRTSLENIVMESSINNASSFMIHDEDGKRFVFEVSSIITHPSYVEFIGVANIGTLSNLSSSSNYYISFLNGYELIESIILSVSDEVTLLTSGNSKLTFRMPYTMTLTDVRASVNTAPTGATIIVDINKSGTSILSTKLTIDATEKTSTTAAIPLVISDTALDNDAEITIDIDQVGSTISGAGLKITLIGTK